MAEAENDAYSSPFGNFSISLREIITLILSGFDQKEFFFEECPWFKFNNLGLVVGKALYFYTSKAKKIETKSQ